MEKENFNDLLKQAQEMQTKLQEAQKTIESLQVVGESGAGLVKVHMTGRHDVTKIEIDDSLFKERASQSEAPEAAANPGADSANKWAKIHNQKEVLEDLLAAAINDAVRKIEKASREQMAVLARGMNLPPAAGAAGAESKE